MRKNHGKSFSPSGPRRRNNSLQSSESLVRVYRQEADRQQLFLKKVRLTEHRLLFIVSALKNLFMDENLVTLLRAEELGTLPAYIAEKIQAAGRT